MGVQTFRQKHKELNDLQDRLLSFLISEGDSLTKADRLKLTDEISRMDRQIKNLEKMNMQQLREPVCEWEREQESIMNFEL